MISATEKKTIPEDTNCLWTWDAIAWWNVPISSYFGDPLNEKELTLNYKKENKHKNVFEQVFI